ncbi:hypothetical protein ADK41_07105 [Streptomyces caelestis]|uniref:Uncharacterized protein n=1 Tax=Streptomyces caelestis TaxID=36816 RepID=A0A0M8QLY8_9ACTN|nr:hypothetical protein ADK41_07105 [Streptomyces caelestis]KOV29948.1 hypothetical protein ADK58_08670 [Streptomyces sp. XY152]
MSAAAAIRRTVVLERPWFRRSRAAAEWAASRVVAPEPVCGTRGRGPNASHLWVRAFTGAGRGLW